MWSLKKCNCTTYTVYWGGGGYRKVDEAYDATEINNPVNKLPNKFQTVRNLKTYLRVTNKNKF